MNDKQIQADLAKCEKEIQWLKAALVKRWKRRAELKAKLAMRIKTRYANGNQINREIIERNGFLYRRFAAHGHTSACWQERIHTGEFHNILDPVRLDILESEYQTVFRDATPDLYVPGTGSWVRA